MRTKQLAGFVILGALLVSVVAFAGDKAGFDRIDTDKSGNISKDELMKADLVVVNGPHGTKRVLHHDLVKHEKTTVLTSDQKQQLFQQLDEDKNGQVSRKEWNRASPNGFILWKF